MPKFRLRKECAPHLEDGVKIEPGQKFESTRDLDKIFANKFDRLSEKAAVTPVRKPFPPKVPEPELEDDEFYDEKVEKDEKAEKLKAEAASEEDDELVETEDEEEEETEPETEPEDHDMDLGADVTDQFKQAKKAGVAVFKDADGHHLVKDGKVVGKAIKDKKAVNNKVMKIASSKK